MPRPSAASPTPRAHRRGTTLVELAMALAVVGGVMGSLVLVNRTLRLEAAEAQTRQTLLTLQAALRIYAAEHHATPAGDASDALLALQAHRPAAGHLADLPLRRDDDDRLHLLDGFGQPLRYQASDRARRLPASFVSAGASGRFGAADADDDAARRAAADNLYGFELEATP